MSLSHVVGGLALALTFAGCGHDLDDPQPGSAEGTGDDEQLLTTAEAERPGCWDFDRGAIGAGIRYLKVGDFTWGGARQTIHAVRVNNDHPAITGYRVNDRDKGTQTTEHFGNASPNTKVAINGDLGNYSTHKTWGLWKAHGAVQDHDNDHAFIAFDPRDGETRIPIIYEKQGHRPLRDDDTPGYAAISGSPELINDGEVVAPRDCPGLLDLCSGRHPRTATGISRDGKFTYMVVVEGRSETGAGMTTLELGRFMKQKICAHNAINHDGGGSSTMWIRGRGVVSRCSDGPCRSLLNHLGVNQVIP